MRFVVDAPLPPELANWLRTKGFEAFAVRELGLRDSSDQTIWNHAHREGLIIVTKDRDFVDLASAVPGPQVIWVRVGNTINPILFARFEATWSQAIALLQAGDRVVELR